MIGSVLGGRCAHFLAAAVVVATALGAIACGERGEPTGSSADLYPVTIVGGNDRSITIAAPAARIASLEPSISSLIATLGARSRVAGAPVGRDGRLLRRALASLHADLVVASSATRASVLSQAATVSGAPVYVAPDTSIREVERAISQLGVITAEPIAARRLVHAIEARRRKIAAQVSDRPEVTAFVDLGDFRGAPAQSLIGDLVREARGSTVGGSSVAGGVAGLDDLLRADPDVYVATSGSGTTLRTLRRDPRARALTAVRKGRVVIIDSRSLEPGPGITRGLEALARALHPDAAR